MADSVPVVLAVLQWGATAHPHDRTRKHAGFNASGTSHNALQTPVPELGDHRRINRCTHTANPLPGANNPFATIQIILSQPFNRGTVQIS